MQTTIHGRCLCGLVQYSIRGPLRHIHHCHCSMCRKQHGAAFATYASLKAERFELLAGEEHLTRFASSEWVRREFCHKCGSSLFFFDMRYPNVISVALGTLDDDPIGRPLSHLHVASKAPWHPIDDDLAQHEAGDEKASG